MIHFFIILILIFAPIAQGAVKAWAFCSIYIIIFALFFIYMFNQISRGEIRIKRTQIDIPILLFFVVSLMATFRSGYIYASIMEIVKFSVFGMIFYLVVNFITTEKDIKKVLDAILASSAGIAFFGILQYLGVIDKSWWTNAKFLSATYVNHNHFAGLMELAIPLSVGMILSEKNRDKRPLYVYVFLILFCAFALSMSRGGWLSLCASMIFMAVVISRKGKIRFIILMSCLLLVVLGGFIFKSSGLDVLLERMSTYRELDFSGRLEIWKGTLDIIKQNWLLGTGPGTFIYNFPKHRPAGLNMFVNYAHNDYLQVFSEMGIFALAAMIFIITMIIKKGMTTFEIAKTPFKSWISVSLAVGVLSVSIHGSGDFNFYIPANAVIFTVFSAIMFNISSKREKTYPQIALRVNPVLSGLFKTVIIVAAAIPIILISAVLSAEIYSTASDSALIKDNLEKAEYLSLAATRLCPFNHSYLYKLANIYNKKARSETDSRPCINKAVERYKEALRLNPIDAWSWIGLADGYYQLSRYSIIDGNLLKLADAAYRKAIDLDPLNWYYLKKRAGFLLNSSNVNLSSQIYERASYSMSRSKLHSLEAEAVINGEYYEEMADLAFAAQDIDRAMAYYEMAGSLKEDKEKAMLGRLRCYLKRFLAREALLKYREARFSAESKAVFFISLGEYYLKRGRIETTLRFLKKAIDINPKNPEAYQLKYKISKKINKAEYPQSEIYKIVNFNHIPVSIDFKTGGFDIDFDVKKDMPCAWEFPLDIFLPAGVYEFNINARGQEALDIQTHMTVRFNNKDIIDAYVSDYWKGYSGIIIVDCAVNRFGIVFDNDYYDEKSKQDRNLYIDGIKLKAL